MKKNLVISLIGHDRVGLVEELSKVVVDSRGNIEASRMAHLGGEFAILMFVTLPPESYDQLNKNVQKLVDEDYKIIITETRHSDPSKYTGWLPFRIEVNGADHEGIIHKVSHQIAGFGINIESMETNVVKAPISGTPLFTLTAVIFVPPDQTHHDWSEKLQRVGDELNVDIEVMSYKG
jgi:glycine cleavage system transcriptional repressor